MYSEQHTVGFPAGIHNGTLAAFTTHFQPNTISINGYDPTQHPMELLRDYGRQGQPVEISAETGDPQRDRDAVHISRGIIEMGGNPWRSKVFGQPDPVLPIERYNQAANHFRAKMLGLPQEGPMQVQANHDKSTDSASVSSDMSVVSKWTVVSLGELQQPGGVGATSEYNPVLDGPNPNGLNMQDNAQNSPEQENALQTWVNYAVDKLNRGEAPEAVLAQLAHDGCPDPETALRRAQEQPLTQAPVSDEIGQDPFEIPQQPDPSTSGQMESLSQQPPIVSNRVRIAGTSLTGTEIDRWEGMWGEGTVKVALDDGGTLDVSPEAVEHIDGTEKAHPVSEIQAFIDSMPKVEPSRPYIEARLANLELVRRAVRANISKVGFSDQVKLQAMDTAAENESLLLKETLGNVYEDFEVAYAKMLPRYKANAFEVATASVVPWDGRAREAGAIWAVENFDVAIDDDLSFKSAAAHYASGLGLTGSQFQEFLAGADEHRKVRTEEFTAEADEDHDGPAEALFL